ncbi:MAG TPA: molybdopterin-guanine dinucleotide biosynthesis protein B, partial [Longimicrobiales bacterium]|nr:molybdopterin-guanine dinucleotide biosynthesis protein B [Longimicrobiales bacterium]
KKSGKTTAVLKLVAELRRRGHRVMTIKHGHDFDLDRRGTDSYRHRVEGGAERVVLAGPGQFAILGTWPRGEEEAPSRLAALYLGDADIVVVEGFKNERLPKIEVFRRAVHERAVWDPDHITAGDYIGGVTDDRDYARRTPFPTVDADDPGLAARLADLVEARVIGREE